MIIFWRQTLLLIFLAGCGPAASGFSVLTYNVKGNGATNWSTNATQVQAIGRQVKYLQPDIITFNEIPFIYTWQMTNFVRAWLPGYFLATNSGTDGAIRSVIASRYPIARSDHWLARTNLAAFGYDGSFTRDLFEAEIQVPDYAIPVHVFTTHLKAGTATNDSFRRAAECSAISNFLVHTFLPQHTNALYVLTGDFNEDIGRPVANGYAPIPRLTNVALGLRLTTPRNPYNQDDRTISSTSPFRRYDYIMPCDALFSNIATSQVFRADLLSSLPSRLNADDTQVASDHMPVMMFFTNLFRIGSVAIENSVLRLTWPTVPNWQYYVESSADLTTWGRASSNITATTTTLTWTANPSAAHQAYRVRQQ